MTSPDVTEVNSVHIGLAYQQAYLSQKIVKVHITLCPKIGPKDDGSQSPPSLFVHRQTQLLSESLGLRFCLVFGTQYL